MVHHLGAELAVEKPLRIRILEEVHVPSQESAGSARKVGVKKAEARLAGGSRSSDIHTDAKEERGTWTHSSNSINSINSFIDDIRC